MSTLHTIKMLGKNELELFERMCGLVINDDYVPKSLFSLPKDVKSFMRKLNIDFGSLQILQNLGLFLPNEMSRSIENLLKQNYAVSYFGKQILFEPSNETNLIIIVPGFYELSITGKQLIQHLEPKFNTDYFNWLKSNYKIPNYKLVEN